MNTIIITTLCSVLTSTISSIVTFFVTKKKYNVEVDHVEIQNMRESLNFYKELSENNQKVLIEILTKSEELANSNVTLLIEVQNLKVQVGILLQIINSELGEIDLSKYGIEIQDGTIIRKKPSKKSKKK